MYRKYSKLNNMTQRTPKTFLHITTFSVQLSYIAGYSLYYLILFDLASIYI